jgi:hypothetical protein
MLKTENNNLYNVLFANNKLIRSSGEIEKNNSEELLTIQTLVLISPPLQEMEEYVQLEKMLTACKLQKEQYHVETLIKPWSHYRNFDNIKEVLLFGIQEEDLGINVRLFDNQIHRFDDRTWIKSISIAQMADNQQVKNNLWQNALKPHFVGQ